MKNFDLKYFIMRTNILLLYREALKFTYQIKDPTVRSDLQIYLRNEFELNRHLEDRKKIEYLIGYTRKKLNTFKETYYMSN
jgi:hypothetical protein